MSDPTFNKKLEIGKAGESLIAKWLIRNGWVVLPVYEIAEQQNKGPQVFYANGEIIAPDLLVMKRFRRTVVWIEAKHKSVFTWYFNNGDSKWETGIDKRHYENYQKLLDVVPWDIWLMFLHRENAPDKKDLQRFYNCPAVCPTGLYGRNLHDLIGKESHTSDRWASGMVYWTEAQLKRIATLKEFFKVVD